MYHNLGITFYRFVLCLKQMANCKRQACQQFFFRMIQEYVLQSFK